MVACDGNAARLRSWTGRRVALSGARARTAAARPIRRPSAHRRDTESCSRRVRAATGHFAGWTVGRIRRAKRRGASQIYLRADRWTRRAGAGRYRRGVISVLVADGRSIGFFAGRKLKKIAVSGGRPRRSAMRRPAAEVRGTPTASLSSRRPPTRDSSAYPPTAEPFLQPPRSPRRPRRGHRPQLAVLPRPTAATFSITSGRRTPRRQGIYVAELDTPFISPRVLADSWHGRACERLSGVRQRWNVAWRSCLTNGTFASDRRAASHRRSRRIFQRDLWVQCDCGISRESAGLWWFGRDDLALMWFGRDGKPGEGLGNAGIYLGPRLSSGSCGRVIVAATGETMADRDLWGLDVARNTPIAE